MEAFRDQENVLIFEYLNIRTETLRGGKERIVNCHLAYLTIRKTNAIYCAQVEVKFMHKNSINNKIYRNECRCHSIKRINQPSFTLHRKFRDKAG